MNYSSLSKKLFISPERRLHKDNNQKKKLIIKNILFISK